MKYIHFQTPYRNRHLRTLDQLIEDTVGTLGPFGERVERRSAAPARPRAALTQSEQAYRLQVELPGVGPGQLTLEVHDGALRLEAGVLAEAAASEATAKPLPRFRLAVAVPEDVQVAGIAAKLENGLLTVDLPKTPKAVARTIEIQ